MLSEKQLTDKIKRHIHTGTDVNTAQSTYRIVKRIDDQGIVVPNGRNEKMRITWGTIYQCYKSLFSRNGYCKDSLLLIDEKLALSKSSSVNTIGRILIIAELAEVSRRGNGWVYWDCEYFWQRMTERMVI